MTKHAANTPESIFNTFYALGASRAMGHIKQANIYGDSIGLLTSRLAPLGIINNLAGVGYRTLGGYLGNMMGIDQLIADNISKVLKDVNTLSIGNKLTNSQAKKILAATPNFVAEEMGAGLLGGLHGTGLNKITGEPVGSFLPTVSTVLTNRQLKKILDAKAARALF